MYEYKPSTKKLHPDAVWQNRAIREKRGTGSGENYIPFIQVRRGDFPSRGLSSTLPIPNLGRRLHLLSVLEYQVTLHVLHAGVSDLREQYPLRLEDDDQEFSIGTSFAPGTLSLSAEMRIRHPQISSTTPRILTTDLVASGFDGSVYAIFVRYASDMPQFGSRQYELLELQRQYWHARSVRFVTITEKQIDPKLVTQLIWALDGIYSDNSEPTPEFLSFLRSYDLEQPLLSFLSKWKHGAANAVARFKTGIFYGHIEIPSLERVHPSLNQSWSLRIREGVPKKDGLRKFLLGLPGSQK